MPSIALIAQNMLLRLGMQARCAENGQEALDLLLVHALEPPVLVLMDCQMPVMDGYAATRTIRVGESMTGSPRMRIVALTGGAFESDRQMCRDAGMDDYVTKPFAFEQLSQIVNC